MTLHSRKEFGTAGNSGSTTRTNVSTFCETEDDGGKFTTPERKSSLESPGEICGVTKVEIGSEGKSLVLLQVNCSSICNKVM